VRLTWDIRVVKGGVRRTFPVVLIAREIEQAKKPGRYSTVRCTVLSFLVTVAFTSSDFVLIYILFNLFFYYYLNMLSLF
jgi:hypothetical protein